MKKKLGSRLLSLLLAVTMVAGYLGLVAPVEAEAAVEEYAAPATKEELDAVASWFAADNGAVGTAAFFKIINGVLYSWGQNVTYCLGLKSYTDLDGNVHPVAANTVVPVPTAVPQSYFNNEKITRLVCTYQSPMVLTDQNHLYTWGYVNSRIFGADPSVPRLLDTSNIGSKKIVDFRLTGSLIYIKTEDGSWYTCGDGNNAGAVLQVDKRHVEVPAAVDDKVLTVIGNKKIAMIDGAVGVRTLVLTEDGEVYGFGQSIGWQHTLGIENDMDLYADKAVKYSELPLLTGKKFTYIAGEDQALAMVTTDGDVWAWGSNSSNRLGPGDLAAQAYITAKSKIFDHNVFQKKAVRVSMAFNRTIIICDDNTVYAMGSNANGAIMPSTDASVVAPTQIFSELSQQYTLVGVFSCSSGIMAITKSGDMLFAGDNSTGGAGTGTTDNNAGSGPITVTSPTMPPSEPMTKNMVSYEIEVEEKTAEGTTIKARYTPDTTGDGTTYTKVAGKTTTTKTALTVDAGTPFKLNVYFEDFGKINTFVMPIRFDPSQLEVVNGAGKAYSSDSAMVTPGALGASVGIEQCFDTKDWLGGTLAVGTKDNTYPKISNGGGWVSVFGYSADSNPIIQDKVKMFSISFRARKTVTGNGIAFDFATMDNIPTSATQTGYDITCTYKGNQNNHAYWSVYNAADSSPDNSGYFEFNNEPFPHFSSRLVDLKALGMDLTYGATNTPVTDKLTSTNEYNPGWTINWSNTSVTYTLKSLPYSDAARTKEGASFPQVNWSFDTAYVENPTNRDREWDDYITVIDTQDTYVKFKINPNFTPLEDEAPGFIKVTSKGQQYPSITTTYYIRVKSFKAPSNLDLAQKVGDTLVNLADGQEMVYHYTDSSSEDKTFWVNFGGLKENLDVVWTLLDKDGDPIDMSDPTAKVTMKKEADHVTIEPHYTTAGEDYVTLHVESLYDSNVYDEVKIKVQLYATELKFTPNLVRMAVAKEGVSSTIDLKPYLGVTPVDVYATNYTWEVSDVPTGTPGNAADVTVPEGGVVYGSMGSGSTASIFTAFEFATPKSPEEYVTVTVTDTLSGQTADIQICIMDIKSPIGIDQFVATNNLGTQNDTVYVKAGADAEHSLMVGDKVEFFNSYEDALNNAATPYMTTTIVEGMQGNFQFKVGNKDSSLMKGEGGFFAVKISRKANEGDTDLTAFDPVPVSYLAEPSLVDGYVHLFGKNAGSVADKDIRIDLEGPNFKETVYTDNTGYFKFTKYIAPGKYSMVVSKKNYLTRRMQNNASGVGAIQIQVNEDGEFHISTEKNPILLFPGELTNDNAITVADINYYVANWVGQYDGNIIDFDTYDFREDNLITPNDLELLLMRKDWISGTYPVWNVPKQ